jgi:hypothetical protein
MALDLRALRGRISLAAVATSWAVEVAVVTAVAWPLAAAGEKPAQPNEKPNEKAPATLVEKSPDGWYRDTTRPGAPARLPLHLRGSFNDWKPGLRLRSDDGLTYTVEVQLAAGRHEFKVGDFQWRTIDFGADRREVLSRGEWTLMRQRGGNMSIEVPTSGRYTVSFKWADGAKASSQSAWVQVDGPR